MAPSIDIERDILAQMPFKPAIEGPQVMDPLIFQRGPMGLRERMLDIRIGDRLSSDGNRLAGTLADEMTQPIRHSNIAE